MANTGSTGADGGRNRVLVGAIAGVRGLKGEVRIKSFTADPAAIGDYGPLDDEAGTQSFTLSVTGLAKGQVIARIKGVDDRSKAEALKGTRLYVARENLPPADEGEYYVADLIGLEARTPDGTLLGRVVRVDDHGAGAMLEIEGPGAPGGLLVAFSAASVPDVDLERGVLVVDPPETLDPPPGGEIPDEAGEE